MTAPPPDGVDCSVEAVQHAAKALEVMEFRVDCSHLSDEVARYHCERGSCKCASEKLDTIEVAAAMLRSLRARVKELEAQRDALRLVPTHVALDLAEIPGRDSPDDQPHMLLVTSEEIAGAVANRINAALARSTP